MNTKVKRMMLALLMGVLVLQFEFAFDNRSDIQERIQKFQSLNSDMEILNIGKVYYVYNKKLFILNQDFAQNSEIKNGILVLSNSYENSIKKDTIVLSTFNNSINAYYNKDIYYGYEAAEVLMRGFSNKVYGSIVCLYSHEVFYSFAVFGGRDWKAPGILKKHISTEQGLMEIQPPFYKLNFTAQTNADIEIFDSIEGGKRVAIIAKGTDIRILGVKLYSEEFAEGIFLLEGKTGIIGWHKAIHLRTEVGEGELEAYAKEKYSLDFLDYKYDRFAG